MLRNQRATAIARSIADDKISLPISATLEKIYSKLPGTDRMYEMNVSY